MRALKLCHNFQVYEYGSCTIVLSSEVQEDENRKKVIYFCGHSLGLQPKKAKEAVVKVRGITSVLNGPVVTCVNESMEKISWLPSRKHEVEETLFLFIYNAPIYKILCSAPNLLLLSCCTLLMD